MYKINDAVVYASYGVCMIKAVETRNFSGENTEYYVLQPLHDSRNTFYIPVENDSLKNKMKKVYTREEVNELIKAMPEKDFIWIENNAERKEKYRKILENGNRDELVRLIKTLYIKNTELNKQNKKLLSVDEHFLHDAENILYDEFAYALEIPKDEVLPYIKSHI